MILLNGQNTMMDLIEWPVTEQEIWWNDGKRNSGTHRKKSREPYDKLHERPFIAWDGEGITYPGNPQQAYVLFAASTGDYIVAGDGNCLSTQECLNLLFRVEEQVPDAYHIGFGFGYDVNQIFNSFSRRNLYALAQCTKTGRTFWWEGYRIKLHPGKMIRISKGEGNDKRTVTIYDTFGFFQTSFLRVVESYFSSRLASIQAGKGTRSSFRYADINEIIRYCLAENRLLVDIMGRLRENFEKRGLYLRDWHGPGAVASASLKKHSIKKSMGEIPKIVSQCSRLAYQGGRFELLRAGYHKGKVWQYDINSAYPRAIVTLPDLSKGTWEYTRTFEPGTFAVWNCSYVDRRNDRHDRNCAYRAQPLFYRDSNGRVAYPPKVEGWYWTPEVENLTGIHYPADISIKEGWVFRGGDSKPFKHIEDIYYERQELIKRYGKGGLERVLKLEMNSYYGKFAQRSGWFKPGDRIPTYHQLEWAGFITSYTRAALWRIYNLYPGAIFAFETDAIFSTQKLPLPISSSLGGWSRSNLDDILYIQSGFYFAHSSDGDIAHYRGFDRGSLTFDMVYDWLDKLDPRDFGKIPEELKLYGPTKRFIGFKRALLSRNKHYWRTWDTSPREITIGREGKRIHLPGCPICRSGGSANHSDGISPSSGGKWTDGLHGLTTALPGGESKPHKIPWAEEALIRNEINIWDEEDKLDICDGREV